MGARLTGIGRIAPESLPGILKGLGLKSVMIEGGSKVLSSFLRSPSRSGGSPVVDTVVVTVAPMFIGEGVGVVPEVSLNTPQVVRSRADGPGGRACFTRNGDGSHGSHGQRYSHGLHITPENALMQRDDRNVKHNVITQVTINRQI